MATFVLSDVHGHIDKYLQMLDKIRFSNNDILYVLGDILNRGIDGIKILQDMIQRENVYPIMGNHELLTLPALDKLSWADDPIFDEEVIEKHTFMSTIGDKATLRKFIYLPKTEKQKLIEYIKDFPLYKQITVNNQKYLLVHAGLPDFSPGLDFSYYSAEDLTFGKHDYTIKHFNDIIIITGHIPTFNIDEGSRGKIYRKNNNIAIDCGMGSGEKLGCLCLDTNKEFYI